MSPPGRLCVTSEFDGCFSEFRCIQLVPARDVPSGGAGSRTWTIRPPSCRGVAWTSPPWVWATDRTMDNPRPAPRPGEDAAADGVVDQVLGEPLQQDRVAGDWSGPQVGMDLDAGGACRSLGFGADVPCDVSEIRRGGVCDALFAAGQSEQSVDEPLVTLVDGEQGAAKLT